MWKLPIGNYGDRMADITRVGVLGSGIMGSGLAEVAAQRIAAAAVATVAARGHFTLAFSGGRTPWQVYRLLARIDLPWDRLHLLQVDLSQTWISG